MLRQRASWVRSADEPDSFCACLVAFSQGWLPMRISGRSLALLWLLGAAGFELQLTFAVRRAQRELPHVRASVRTVREREAQGRLDSAFAYAHAPVSVTATGDTNRALAYASVPHWPSNASLPLWPRVIGFVWVFAIPIALLALTFAYVAGLVRRKASTSAGAT